MTTATAPLLEIKRVFDASPERIFSAWMKRDEWETWIGPEGGHCDVTLFEPRVGGRYRLLMHLTDGREMPVVGVFRAIEPPHRIALSWKWELGEDDSLVTISLRAVGSKTELTLRHEGLHTQSNCDAHSEGWNSALNKLEKYLGNAG